MVPNPMTVISVSLLDWFSVREVHCCIVVVIFVMVVVGGGVFDVVASLLFSES